MEFVNNFLKGQKKFITDVFALIDLILLSFAYILGVGISFIFLKKDDKQNSDNSFWKNSELTKKEKTSFLRQF